eukprot:XP_003979301.1 PREDICTED: nardilysin-like [Takifugu rubripes]
MDRRSANHRPPTGSYSGAELGRNKGPGPGPGPDQPPPVEGRTQVAAVAASDDQGDPEIIKSPSDPKKYRYIELSNGLRALLISDFSQTGGTGGSKRPKNGVISAALSLLTPDRVNLLLLSPEHEGRCSLTEKWFGTSYSAEDLSAEWVERWAGDFSLDPELHLPAENRFIATDFTLKAADCENSDVPVQVVQVERGALWFKKDDKFQIPRAYIRFHLISPVIQKSPESLVLFDLLVNILAHNLSEPAYEAEVAHLDYRLVAAEHGLVVRLKGFNHKLPLLLKLIVDHLADFGAEPGVFAMFVEQLKKAYFNVLIRPECLGRDVRLMLLQHSRWSVVQKYRAIMSDPTREQLLTFVSALKAELYAEGLVQGNFSSAESKEFLQYFIDCYHSGLKNLREHVLMELMVMHMEEPCFNFLRTKETLGYQVYSSCRNTCGLLGFSVTVETQATKFSTELVEQKIEEFLVHFGERLSSLSEEAFRTQVTALIKLKECEDAHLGEEVDRHWFEVVTQQYLFRRLEKEIKALKLFSREDLLSWFLEHRTSSRKLSVHVVGFGGKEDPPEEEGAPGPACSAYGEVSQLTFLPACSPPLQDATLITDIRAFTSSLHLHPHHKILS